MLLQKQEHAEGADDTRAAQPGPITPAFSLKLL